MAAYYASLNGSLLREIEEEAERESATQAESSTCDTPSSSSNSVKDESTNYINFTSQQDPRHFNPKQRRYDTAKVNAERSLGISLERSQSHGNIDHELRDYIEDFQRRSEQLGNRIVANIRRLDVSLEHVQRIVSADMEKKEEIHKLVKEMRELCKNFVGSNADMIHFFERSQTQASRWERELSELGEEIQHPPRMTDVDRNFFSEAGGPREGWNETTPTTPKEVPKLIEQFPDKDAGPKELRTLSLHLEDRMNPSKNQYRLGRSLGAGLTLKHSHLGTCNGICYNRVVNSQTMRSWSSRLMRREYLC